MCRLLSAVLPRIAETTDLRTRYNIRGAARARTRRSTGPRGQGRHNADGVLQLFNPAPTIPAPLLTFEGMSNQDNFNIFGFRVNPPDPNGEVGPNNYVEMINLVFAVYDKAGNLLVGPIDTGSLWSGFPVTDCTDPSGDPVVLYDQFMDRWLLSQFTTAGPEYFNCVAISTTSDPTGSYYRYAFSTGVNFPDYPEVRQLDGLIRDYNT